MSQIKGGELLLRCLHQEKVKHIHAITDGTYMSMLEPLERLQGELGIRLVVPRHEAAAAHFCDAYTRMTGSPAVVMACAGPGAANVLSGLICAESEGSPVIAITTTRRSEIGDSYAHQAAMQVGDQQGYFKAAVKWSGKVDHWHRIPDMVRHAFRMATSGRPGPVHLLIPQDILDGMGDLDSVKLYTPEQYRFTAMAKQAANPELIQQAAKMLVESKLACIHVGNGCERAQASDEVIELGELLGMPMTKTARSISLFPCNHPLALNTLSMGGMLSHHEPDTLLVVGTRLGEMSAFGNTPAWGEPDNINTIQIDAEPTNIALNRPVDLGLVGDAKTVLRQLIDSIKPLLKEPREVHPKVEEYKGYQTEWRKGLDKVSDDMQDPMCVGTVYRECNKFYEGQEAITIFDGGNTPFWGFHYHVNRPGAKTIHSTAFGHLGTGLPYAIGAKLAFPEKPVYCVSGDSAFNFNIQELETALREDLPVITLVTVDGAWGMEKTAQKRTWGREAPWFGIHNAEEIRYDKICEAVGGHGEYVTKASEIIPALERATAAGKVAVIHCVIDPDSNVWPPGIEIWNALRSGNFDGM